MVATGKVPPPGQAETQDTVGLTRWQKAIGICLLFFYLAMIAITIATLPYVADVATQSNFQ